MSKKCPGRTNCKVKKCGTNECPLIQTLWDKIKRIFKKS